MTEIRTEEDIETWVATLPQGFRLGLQGRALHAQQLNDEAHSTIWGDEKKARVLKARRADTELRAYLVGALEAHDHRPHYDVLSAYVGSIIFGHRVNKEQS